jgi:hypothetical protein
MGWPPASTPSKMNFVYDSGGIGKGGTAAISVDGREVATGRIKKTVPVRISQEEGLRPEMIGRARPQRIARLASRSVGRSEGGLVGAQPTIWAGRVSDVPPRGESRDR